MSQPVVVGVDGSDRSLGAVDLAAHEAVVRDRALRIVCAFTRPHVDFRPRAGSVRLPDVDPRHDAERIVREATERASAGAATVNITGEVVERPPAPALIEQSHAASLVVVGNRGLGGFAGLLVGSVALELATYAGCPVLVARGRAARGGDVLVGVDGSPPSDIALRFAFEEAALRGVGLTAVYAWTLPATAEPVAGPLSIDYTAEVEAAEQQVLRTAIGGCHDQYPDVRVRGRLVRDGARQALINASEQAQLLVVGSRGRGGFTGLLLGSVSQAMLQHSACPVAIVRRPREPGTAVAT